MAIERNDISRQYSKQAICSITQYEIGLIASAGVR